MRVRAVTVFVSPREWSTESIHRYVEDAAVKANEIADIIKKRIEVWSVRVALPPLPEGVDPVRVATAAFEAAEANGVRYIAAIHINIGGFADIEKVAEAIEMGVYGSALVSRIEYAEKAAKLLTRISRRELLAATRFALVFGSSWPLTPYFPIAVQTRSGIGFGLAALYVDDIMAGLSEETSYDVIRVIAGRVFSLLEEVAKTASNETGIDYYGIDASLSPWMSESVAMLIERLMGDKIGSLGTLSVIRELNRIVRGIASTLDAIGFNEVMLPVAEDDVLKARVGEGRVRLRDLILYSTMCVAGVDMVAVGEELGLRELTGLVRDMYAVYKLKGFEVGLRLIRVEGCRAGDEIQLGMFGRVPVARL